MTNKTVWIVYRNHEGVVKEYLAVPHEKTLRFDFPWTGNLRDDEMHKAEKAWVFDAEVVKDADNVTRTFEVSKILEWRKA